MYGHKSQIYCSGIDKIPTTKHWAILETKTIHVEGDERSRTHPGHGYSASTEYSINYIAFTNKDEWLEDIQERHTSKYRNTSFRAIEVNPATIALKTEISVN